MTTRTQPVATTKSGAGLEQVQGLLRGGPEDKTHRQGAVSPERNRVSLGSRTTLCKGPEGKASFVATLVFRDTEWCGTLKEGTVSWPP